MKNIQINTTKVNDEITRIEVKAEKESIHESIYSSDIQSQIENACITEFVYSGFYISFMAVHEKKINFILEKR